MKRRVAIVVSVVFHGLSWLLLVRLRSDSTALVVPHGQVTMTVVQRRDVRAAPLADVSTHVERAVEQARPAAQVGAPRAKVPTASPIESPDRQATPVASGSSDATSTGATTETSASLTGVTGSDKPTVDQTAATLALIRDRLQSRAADVYPARARRAGLVGTVVLEIELAPSGSLIHSRLTESSGSRVLDAAAERLVQAAGPYPYLAGPLRIPIVFRLNSH